MTNRSSLLFSIEVLLKGFNESLGNLEGVIGNGVPEVMILGGIGVTQGDVADYPEGDERYLVDITGLGDGT
jgi:hypothetical protein